MATRRLFNREAFAATTVAAFIIAQLCDYGNASTTTAGADRAAIEGGDVEPEEHDDGRSIDDILNTPPPPGNRTRGRMQDANVFKVELDILYTEEQWTRRMNRSSNTRFRRNAPSNKTWLWPNAIVPYEIPTNWGSKEERLLEAAMKPFRTHTCIRFVKFTYSNIDEDDYWDSIVIENQGDCSSFVGRKGGPQSLSLSSQCMKVSVIIHELGHAIGLYHEHNRPDRDEYVTINWENVFNDSISTNDFQKNDPSEVDLMGTRYDYLSIMHYGEKAFSKNEKNTISARNSTYQRLIGRSKNLGFSDIKRINNMYKCADRSNCRKKPCPDDGFVGNDCRCWCPPKVKIQEPIELCHCVDYDTFCDAFKVRGFCTRRLFRRYMEEMCPRSCGICSSNSATALLRG